MAVYVPIKFDKWGSPTTNDAEAVGELSDGVMTFYNKKDDLDHVSLSRETWQAP
jgi:hypothetical protein